MGAIFQKKEGELSHLSQTGLIHFPNFSLNKLKQTVIINVGRIEVAQGSCVVSEQVQVPRGTNFVQTGLNCPNLRFALRGDERS